MLMYSSRSSDAAMNIILCSYTQTVNKDGYSKLKSKLQPLFPIVLGGSKNVSLNTFFHIDDFCTCGYVATYTEDVLDCNKYYMYNQTKRYCPNWVFCISKGQSEVKLMQI